MLRLLRLFLVIAATGAVLAGTVLFVAPYGHDLVTANVSEDQDIDLNRLDSYAVRSYVYASDGTTLTTWHNDENRSPVTLDVVPQQVRDAVLAVEDADFYQHGGVNLKGTFRALVENVSAGAIEQGGSTLTQQLVKNALLTTDQNFNRKSEEAALAVRLEQKLVKIAEDNGATDPVRVAKDNILEKYLNTVYFGSGTYGVQAASEIYWGKSVSELNVADSAMLAALIRNPNAYDPTLHPEAAKKQRQIALDRMAQLNKITVDQARTLGQLPVPANRCVADNPDPSCGDHRVTEAQSFFLNEVQRELGQNPVYGIPGVDVPAREKTLFEGGYKVFTTLDLQANAVAEDVVANGPPPNNQCIKAAMVGVEPTGAVRIMASGPFGAPTCAGVYNPDKQPELAARAEQPNKYNLTTATGRQVGSTFKTYTLLTAFEQGNAPSDQIGGPVAIPIKGARGRGCVDDDKNKEGNQYCVDEGSGGSLDQSTTSSSNSAFARLYQVVGPANVADVAKKLGITANIVQNASGALGTSTISPIEMASAYSTIPNAGVHEPYYFIDRVEDRNGKVIYQHQGAGQQAVSKQSACLASTVLQHNVQGGTGTKAQLPKQPAAGKTGTTDDGADTWFVGFTPYLTTAVWMGNPFERTDTKFIGGVENFGGQFPATMWGRFMTRYQEGRPVKNFDGCAAARGNGSVKGKGDNQLVFGFSIGGGNQK